MIDEKLEPWLIEVNTNPCLEETSALLKKLLPRMLDDAFKLSLDKLFPPPVIEGEKVIESAQHFPIDDHPDSANLW